MARSMHAVRRINGIWYALTRNSKRPTVLVVIVMLIGLSAWSVVHIPKALAAAKSVATLAADIPDAKNTIIGWEDGCTSTLAGYRSSNPDRSTNGQNNNVNQPGSAYSGDLWISKGGSGATITSTYSPSTTTIPLQLNRVSFLCSAVVSPPPRAPGSDTPRGTNIVSSGSYPNDLPPVPDNSSSTINAASLYEVNMNIVSATVTSGDGTISGLSGVSIKRDNASRYWIASPDPFTFMPNATLTPGTHTLTIQIVYRTISTYHAYGSSGTSRCTLLNGNGADIAYNDFKVCRTYTTTKSFEYTISAPTVACGPYIMTPARVDPYMTFDIHVSATTNARALPADTQVDLQVFGSGYSYDQTLPATRSGGTASATFVGVGPTNHTGNFQVSWIVSSASGGFSKTCGFQAGITSDVISIADLPYLSVFGGDAEAGSSPEGNTNACIGTPNTSAGAYSWNKAGTPAGDFSGAGAQYAVMVLGQIQGFASSLGNGTNPARLSFANTLSSGTGAVNYTTSDLFGGAFGGSTSDCNFSSDAANTAVLPTTVSGTQIMHVTGDLHITNNITYGTSWADPASIPYFKVVVTGGNIYIDKNVTQLDGLYVAEPTTTKPTTGIIYTCAQTGGGPQYSVLDPNYYNDCKHQLTINGSFVARSVQFLRTYGSLGQAAMNDNAVTSQAAEVFNYSPEMWIPRGTGTPSSGYDSITGLPPVL